MNSLILFAYLFMYRVISVPMPIRQKVLATSALYGPCTYHDDCCEADFCDASGYCSKCEECHFHVDSVDRNCPSKCPATCEDQPPQYPKCNLCSSQEECDAMFEDGLVEEEEHMLPTCNDDSGYCDPDDTCRNVSFSYSNHLEQWFASWYQDNIKQFENLQPEDEMPMPQLVDLPGGGDEFCFCFHAGIQCVADNKCFIPTQEDLEDLKEMPWTFHDWCLSGMKCSHDQCAWAEGLEEALFGQDGGNWTDNCAGHDECGDDRFCYEGHCAGCEECHFNWDAIDGECPEKCPVLCEDHPPQYPKCPICNSQEECDAMYDSGFQEEEENPWPECTDGTDRCPISSSDCAASLLDHDHVMGEWAEEWFRTHPNATEMPPLTEWPDANDFSCQCIRFQAECIIDNDCYSDEGIEELEALPFTLEEWCSVGLKCGSSDCEWTSWQHNGYGSCHDFVSVRVNKIQKKFQERKIQKEMKSKFNHKKHFRTAVKMAQFSALHQALP